MFKTLDDLLQIRKKPTITKRAINNDLLQIRNNTCTKRAMNNPVSNLLRALLLGNRIGESSFIILCVFFLNITKRLNTYCKYI